MTVTLPLSKLVFFINGKWRTLASPAEEIILTPNHLICVSILDLTPQMKWIMCNLCRKQSNVWIFVGVFWGIWLKYFDDSYFSASSERAFQKSGLWARRHLVDICVKTRCHATCSIQFPVGTLTSFHCPQVMRHFLNIYCLYFRWLGWRKSHGWLLECRLITLSLK